MSRTISEAGQALLDDLPPYLADDEVVQGVVDTLAREQKRIADAADAIRTTAFPGNADDSYGLLSLWEALLGLPVKPTGVTDSARRAKVLASLQKRDSGSGSAWVATLTQAFGTALWSHAENTPGAYQVTLYVPFPAGSYEAQQAVAIARLVTPAHLDLLANYGTGFIVGVSFVGVDVL